MSLFNRWAPPRWVNPHCDVGQERALDQTRALESVPITWPEEMADEYLSFGPPTQVPYLGSVSGQPFQAANPDDLRTLRVWNEYGGAVVKGNLPFSRIALGRGDAPHRMGLVFKELGTVRDDTVSDGIVRSGAGSDGQRADFTYPRYGQWFRLSSEAYQRLSADADFEQQWVLDAAREYGFVPYDRGGYGWAPKVGMIAGADWAGSTVGDLRIRTRDLERVTVGAT